MRIAIGFHRTPIHDWQELATYTIEAERLGVDQAWSAEAWAHDVFTPLAFLAPQTSTIKLGTGILQIGTRTPALVGMTSMAMQGASNGRFMLGIGTSGPQVIEGWHGVKFNKPLKRTRELIEIVRMVSRGQVVAYDGEFHQLPIEGGEGKALRSEATPVEIPIYLAALGPKNLEMCGELCEGWLGGSFIPEHADIFFEHIARGAAKAGRTLADIDLAAGGGVEFTDDLSAAIERGRRGLAFSLGAMGSMQHNFYNDAYSRQGWREVCKEVQRLWLSGKRDEARATIPDEMVIAARLIGDESMVRDRIKAYRDCGITTLRVDPAGNTLAERLETLGRVVDIVRSLDREAAAVGV